MSAEGRRRFPVTPGLAIGLGILMIMIVIAAVAPAALGAQADALGIRAARPSAAHLLGTDQLGHDTLARALVATRLTIVMTAAATLIAVSAGIFVGTTAWFLPARLREVVLRIIDAAVAFPALLLALAVAAILGAGAVPAVVAIGVAGIPTFARLTANLAATVSQQEYVSTARLLGVGRLRLITVHLLPNIAEPLLVLTATTFAASLTAIGALSFVGLGVQSPDYDWGKLLSDGLPAILSGRPEQALAPALLIVVTGLAALLVGDGLAAAADPRARSVRARTRARNASIVPSRDDAVVSVDDLTIESDAGKKLVRGVSFTVERGEIVGIVGESGSGKSLTAMALAGLLAEGLTSRAAGLWVDGMDLSARIDPHRLACSVSLIYQDPSSTFNPALKLGTQLTEVLRTHLRLRPATARKTIADALERVQITRPAQRLKQYPYELSGGMRQRSMIAAALSTGPRLLIADEPTTALDVTVQVEILREILRLRRELGTAVLFISHDIGVVRELCDRVLVMRDGEIVEELSVTELHESTASHPYTKRLLAATPRMDDPLPVTTTSDKEPA